MTATDPLALEGRGERPLTAVAAGRPRADEALLDELAERIGDAPRGADRRRPPARPRAARAARRPRRAPPAIPILAEPTSQLRCGPHDRSLVVSAYDAIARDRARRSSSPTWSSASATCRPASRCAVARRRSTGSDQIVVDPPGGWNEPTQRAAAIAARRPGGSPRAWARGSSACDRARDRGRLARRLAGCDAERRPRRRSTAELGGARRAQRAGRLRRARRGARATATSSTPPRACRSATRRLPRRRADATSASSATAAPTASTAWSPRGSAPPRRSGRPTTIVTGDLGLLHDLGGLAALREVATPVRIVVIDNDGGGIFHFLPQAEALRASEFEALLGTRAARAAACSGSTHRRRRTTWPRRRVDRGGSAGRRHRSRGPRRSRSRVDRAAATRGSTAGSRSAPRDGVSEPAAAARRRGRAQPASSGSSASSLISVSASSAAGSEPATMPTPA